MTSATENLRGRWGSLDVSSTFFDHCIEQPIFYLPPENYERTLYFFGCEAIEFQDEVGTTIWSTTGDGKMDKLPVKIGVLMTRGKYMIT